ncbi:MAG TPA: phosphate propanoyltransferase [Acholeplasmataceae bacterium]|nr:phosphate propanoyltransferase [Acholeplasmataceae bacterium]
MKIPVGISGRHAHLSKEHLEILFGKGYELTPIKDLSQPGQFAADEKIDLVSADGREIKGIRILGPVRKETQVELSHSDARRVRIDAPVRSSGDIKGSAGAKIVGPKGEVTIAEGVIVADRHIHFSPEDAIKFGVKDRDVVAIKVSGLKAGILENVLCRVSESYVLDCHLDTDDGSAFLLNNGDFVELVKEYKIVK